MTATTVTATPGSAAAGAVTAGWLLLAPGGYPHSWWAPKLYPDIAAVWQAFADGAAHRRKLQVLGWQVIAGDATALLGGQAPARVAV